ncbi:TRAP transporter substrate-binding protein DctP [Seohaeicola nanhaiensis]|uniref:TRAP transporter substrate-binding protein DctP n=1 Tax=Seohaeicola nanhaiensis TaxID=1387282 RepID=A0ABV9KC05_9RHOB
MTKTITRRSILSGAPALAGGAFLAAPATIAAASSATTWRMQTHFPTGTWYYDAIFQDFARRVTTATNGELVIETHAPGSIVSTGDSLMAAAQGALDGAFTFPAYWVGQIPAAGHLNGNLATFSNNTEMEYFMYEMGALDIIREAYAERGIHQVGPVAGGGVTLFGKRPIHTAADFQGYKIRTTGTAARVLEKMGAAPVSVAGGELYQALQTGIVDAAHWGSVSGGMSMNFQEVTKYIVQPDLVSPTNLEVFVNAGKWSQLGEDHKQVVNDAVRATTGIYTARIMQADLNGIDTFVNKSGGEISMMEASVLEEMRMKSLEVVDEISAQDPKYSGRIGELLHEFMRQTGKV